MPSVTALTEREMEALKLIAETLVISKLHLVDRTQAAAYAWQEDIIHRE